ncbi:MAG: nucleotidyltransferase family protein [Bacteroidales bacterium]|nr:nucleotidyltransferase family protein [Bacteroidales bacterium]
MKTLPEIKSILQSHKKALSIKYPIKSLAVFGSYARNEQTKISDVDIVVEFYDSVGIEFIDLAEELENLLGVKVDLVSKSGIRKGYFDSIKSDLIYV